ncbi:hypothetical protein MY3296_007869 [Beauveria thailandica]
MKARLSLPSSRQASSKSHALIYFIPGNPGVVEFYTDFLSSLRALLDKTESGTALDIYGRNLLGFHDGDHEPFGPENLPFDLDAQVEGMWADIASQRYGDTKDKPYDFVILIGHSIGAYIAVETFHRQAMNPKANLNLQHGFLLFPTISYIARSPSGLKMTALQQSPYLPGVEENLHRIAKALVYFLPQSTLEWLWASYLGFSAAAAATLAAWLKSRDGLWQAIHLGRSELKLVGKDKWHDTFWDAVTTPGSGGVAPKFFFFYGKHDHWVDDSLRDEFIARHKERGHSPGRPSLEVDTEKTPLVKKIAKKYEAPLNNNDNDDELQFTGCQNAAFYSLTHDALLAIVPFPKVIKDIGDAAELLGICFFPENHTLASKYLRRAKRKNPMPPSIRRSVKQRDLNTCLVMGTSAVDHVQIVPLLISDLSNKKFRFLFKFGRLFFARNFGSLLQARIETLRDSGEQTYNILSLNPDLCQLFDKALVGFKPLYVGATRSGHSVTYHASFSFHILGRNQINSHQRVTPSDATLYRMQLPCEEPKLTWSEIEAIDKCILYDGKVVRVPCDDRREAESMLALLAFRWVISSYWFLAGSPGSQPDEDVASNQGSDQYEDRSQDDNLEQHGNLEQHDKPEQHDKLEEHDNLAQHDKLEEHDNLAQHDNLEQHDNLAQHDKLEQHDNLEQHDALFQDNDMWAMISVINALEGSEGEPGTESRS